jgi:two-component system, NarL family, response regulator DesR
VSETAPASGKASAKIRPTFGVVLIDVPQLFRAGMALLLDGQRDMEVLVDAGRADEALEGIRRMRRRRGVIAVVGLSLTGDRDSFWLIRSLREQFPWMPILASASNATDHAVSRALFAGANGFVNKDCDPGLFLDAVRQTSQGEFVLAGVPEEWAATITEMQGLVAAPSLTVREIEVLNVASEGLTSRQIGRRLGLQERTVTTHLSRIYKKLGADSRVSAIRRAASHGLLSFEGR